MTIKMKLVSNSLVIVISIIIIIGTCLLGLQRIKSNIDELTEKSTPYQLKALRSQQTLQAHSANLISTSAVSMEQEFRKISSLLPKSLTDAVSAGEDLAKMKGGGYGSKKAIEDITSEVSNTVKERLSISDETAKAVTSIKNRIQDANRKIKQLDDSIRTLQGGTSKQMVGGVDSMMSVTVQLSKLLLVQEGLSKLQIFIGNIVTAKDKRTAGVRNDEYENLVKKMAEALKATKGIDKTADELSLKLMASTKKVKEMVQKQIKRIGDEDEELRPAIEDMAKDLTNELTYMAPSVEKEVSNEQKAMKSNSTMMETSIGSFSGTNAILAFSSMLSLTTATIESQINRLLNEKKINDFKKAEGIVNSLFVQSGKENFGLKDALLKGGYKNELRLLGESTDALSAVQKEFNRVSEKMQAFILASEKLDGLNAKMRDIVSSEIDKSNKEVTSAGVVQEQSIKSVYSASRLTMITIFGVGIASVLFTLLLGRWIGTAILKQLSELNSMVKDLGSGQGDLTKRLELKGKDEIREIADGFNVFLDKLHKAMLSVAEEGEAVINASHEMQSISKNAGEIAISATNMSNGAQQGQEGIERIMKSMKDFESTIVEATTKVSGLENGSQKIANILVLITDIAKQTNLLALNATVEAARAGEHGLGFAVVADEVKKLAQKTVNAAKEIDTVIEENRADVKNTAKFMKQESSSISVVMKEASEATESQKKILADADRVSGMIQHIAATTKDQSMASTKIAAGVENAIGQFKL